MAETATPATWTPSSYATGSEHRTTADGAHVERWATPYSIVITVQRRASDNGWRVVHRRVILTARGRALKSA